MTFNKKGLTIPGSQIGDGGVRVEPELNLFCVSLPYTTEI